MHPRPVAPEMLADQVGGGDLSSPPRSPAAIVVGDEDQASVLDDAFFDLLLNSDLPEKLAEQINKSLLSELDESAPVAVKQQQQPESSVEVVCVSDGDDQRKNQNSKIGEIAEAITHEPAFEALLAQWGTCLALCKGFIGLRLPLPPTDAETLSEDEEEGENGGKSTTHVATDERYEKIVNEYDDILTDDDEQEGKEGNGAAVPDESEEEQTMEITEEDENEDRSDLQEPSEDERNRVCVTDRMLQESRDLLISNRNSRLQ